MGINDTDYMRRPGPEDSNRAGMSYAHVTLVAFLIVAGLVLVGKAIQFRLKDVDPVQTRLSELQEIQIPSYEKMAPPIYETPAGLKRLVNINTAKRSELESVPYIGEAVARAIIAGRPYAEFSELCKVPGIKEKKLELIRPYLDK